MTDKPKNPAAQALAKLSHRVVTEKRRENARENGKKGGRPKKSTPDPADMNGAEPHSA